MSNSTDPSAQTVHGTNPQYLIEKITRLKIYNSTYWKEECFGLTAATIIDKAVALKYIGGTYGGNNKPSKFLCLLLKVLQLQPDHDIILEFIRNDDFKYLRALGALYLRLTSKAEEIYRYLEPLYNDYRPMIYRSTAGWSVTHMDEFIDSLLREELVCDIALPFIMKRLKLEELHALPPRRSVMEEELAELERLEQEEQGGEEEINDNHELQKESSNENRNINDKESANNYDHTSKSHTMDDKVEKFNEEDVVSQDKNQRGRSRSPSEDIHVHHRSHQSVSRSSSRDRYPTQIDDRRDRISENHTRRDSRDRDNSKYDDDEGRSKTRERGRSQDRDRHRRHHSDSRSRFRSNSRHRRHHDKKHKHHKKDKKHHRHRSRDRSSDRGDSVHSEEERDHRRSHRRDSRDRDRYRDHKYRDDDSRSNREHKHDKRSRDDDNDHYHRKDHKKAKHEDNEESFEAYSSKPVTSSKKPSDKTFDKIFGKKNSNNNATSNNTSGGSNRSSGANPTDNVRGKVIVNDKGEKFVITASEGTVEYWNQMREALGMKKLRT